MMRFIDLRGQIDVYEQDKEKQTSTFAFFNTINDRFVEIDSDQTWDTVQEFRQSCSNAKIDHVNFERLMALIPSWVKEA
jgi:hypothetical protein